MLNVYLKRIRLKYLMVSVLVFASGVFLSWLIAYFNHLNTLSNQRNTVASRLDIMRSDISRELDGVIYLSQGLVSFVKVQQGIEPQQFSIIARGIIEKENSIRNIAIAPNNINEFMYPIKGNEAALGLDYTKNPAQYPAVSNMMRIKKTLVAGPLKLVQGGMGIISRSPVYISEGNTDRYWGLVSTVIDFNIMLSKTGIEKNSANLNITLRGVDGLGASGETFWGDKNIFTMNPVIMDIPLPYGNWQIAALPVGGWMKFSPWKSQIFLAGFFLSILVTLLLLNIFSINSLLHEEIYKEQLAEKALFQKNRALMMLSSCNSVIVHASEESALLDALCEIAVDYAGYLMAWIGKVEQDEFKTVRPITFRGSGEGFLDKIHVSWADNEFGQGTAGKAIRSKKPSIARDLLHDANFSIWRAALESRDYQSAIAIPLIINDMVFGVLLVYAADIDAFDQTEVNLLEELGRNISHGIMAIRLRKEREEMVHALERSREELEIRVEERTRELNIAKEAAESADNLKSAFLASMSHELRTPLNSIIGFTGIILQGLVGELNPEQHKQLTMVRDSAHHLLSLICDVLDISKIESGQLEIRKELFRIEDSISKALNVIEPLAQRKNLSVLVHTDHSTTQIHTDQRRFEQILINLLGNSVKFTESGEITLTAFSSRYDSLESYPEESQDPDHASFYLVVSILDTGIGIKSEDMNKLFSPFRQLDNGTTRKYEGTGLGLSICKKLTELLGGKIMAQSDGPGTGSCFMVILPIGDIDYVENSHY